jgi:hypothetical protein
MRLVAVHVQETLAGVPNVKQWVTNEYKHR